METKISIRNLQVGMYVAQLDRPWLGTPFPVEGFFVRDAATILSLRQYCDCVFVRTNRVGEPTAVAEAPEKESRERSKHGVRSRNALDFIPLRPRKYDSSVLVEEEIEAASRACRQTRTAMDGVLEAVRTERTISVSALAEATHMLADSIVRNPDAGLWLRLLKTRETYTHNHLIDTSILAMALGRHLGYERDDLTELGLGALLLDIGKLKLPAALLNRASKLTPDEKETVKRHVEFGLGLIHDIPGITTRVTETVAAHHERFDGSGYPRGLPGRRIPPFARMVAIADCFDAITSDRPYAQGMALHQAMQNLYALSGVSFQPELIEQFIQCLGTYPTGTLVELNNGSVAIVLGQNSTRRLQPRVILVLEPDRSMLRSWPTMDLALQAGELPSERVVIKRAVEPETYGLDIRQLYSDHSRAEAFFGLSILS